MPYTEKFHLYDMIKIIHPEMRLEQAKFASFKTTNAGQKNGKSK